jgi:iron complex outermembrane receptor protein
VVALVDVRLRAGLIACGFGLATAGLTVAAPADAAPTTIRQFAIPAEPAPSALIDFAVQANVTVGGAQHCAGRSGAVTGRHTVEQALILLLAPTTCDFKQVAPDTFRIVARLVEPPHRTVSPPIQAAAPAAALFIPELIVTATKRQAFADKLPYAVSVLNGPEIVAIGAQDVSGLTGNLAGVSTTNLGPGRDKVLLRGLSDGAFTGRTQSTVGIYLDDTPLTSNAPDPDLRLVDVAAVEVMRGPQGSLYGGASMSGVYRIATQKPRFNVWSESFLAGGSLTQAGAPGGEVEAVLNIPLTPDKTAARLVAYDEYEGGYIDNVHLRTKNIDGVTRSGGRASLRSLLDANWTLTVGAAYQHIDSRDTQYVTPGQGRLHRANAVREGSVNQFADAYVTLERGSAAFDFKSTTSLVEHALSSQTDASTALPLFGGSAPVGEYEEPNATHMLIEDAVLSSPSGGRLQWLVGAVGSTTLEDIQSIVRTSASGPSPALDLYHEWRKDRRTGVGVYAEVSYALTNRLTATVGDRLGGVEISTHSRVEMPVSGKHRLYVGKARSSGNSPKFALDYEVFSGQRLYALISEGRRAGGFNTGGPIGVVFQKARNAPGMHRRFQPDELWNYEVGLKSSLWDGRLKVRTSLFYDVWTNIQTDQYLSSGLSYTDNAGDGINAGSETEVVLRPTEGLTFAANALFDHPELNHPRPGFISQSHAGLPGVPDISGGGRAAYEAGLRSGWSMRFAAEAQYVGRSHVTFDPTLAPIMGGYWLDQLSAQLVGPRWTASAFLINLGGERGNTFSYGNPFNFRQISELTPQRPRTLRFTISAAF